MGTYIAANPDYLKELDNRVRIRGYGDTEFILVFENVLDGRCKYMSIDPKEVIRARLRVTRQVAGAVVAVAGIAANAFGIPIPSSLTTPEKEGTPGTVDYSDMTAETSWIEKRNSMIEKELESVRSFAITELRGLSEENAERVHGQLLRRLSRVVSPTSEGNVGEMR